MATDLQANNYIKTLYHDVWQNYSTREYVKYYDKNIIARSGNRVFHFDEFYDLLNNNVNTLSYMKPEFHQVVAQGNNHLIAWFTTIHHYKNGQEAYRINTMSNYTIKNDKVVAIEFMWDKPIEFVLNFAKKRQAIPSIISPVTGKKLSLRELECFFHIIQNRTTKEIAIIMKISTRTVEAHIEHIKQKLCVSNIRGIIDFAYEIGYLTIAPLFNNMFDEMK